MPKTNPKNNFAYSYAKLSKVNEDDALKTKMFCDKAMKEIQVSDELFILFRTISSLLARYLLVNHFNTNDS